MTKSALTRWSTEELETAILSRSLDNVQMYEAERILRERELAPDRKLARCIYNSVAWTLAFALGTFVVALGIFCSLGTRLSLTPRRLTRAYPLRLSHQLPGADA